MRATPDMLAALSDATTPALLDPWAYSSWTIGTLKKLGWIVARKVELFNDGKKSTRYAITATGQAALERDIELARSGR